MADGFDEVIPPQQQGFDEVILPQSHDKNTFDEVVLPDGHPAATPVRALAYGPVVGESTPATTQGPLGALGEKDVALSPNLLQPNGGPYQLGQVIGAHDSKGNFLGQYRVADTSWFSPGKPTTDTVEFRDRNLSNQQVTISPLSSEDMAAAAQPDQGQAQNQLPNNLIGNQSDQQAQPPVDIGVTAKPAGMLRPGNLDPLNRPVVRNPEGGYSTTLSFSIGTDAGEVLIPRVVNGQILTKKQAEDHYKQTGENLGVFDTPDNADAFATQLHNQQAASPQFQAGVAALKAPEIRASELRDKPAQFLSQISRTIDAAFSPGQQTGTAAMSPETAQAGVALVSGGARTAASALQSLTGKPYKDAEKEIEKTIAETASGFTNPESVASLLSFAVPGVAEAYAVGVVSKLPDQFGRLKDAIQAHGLISTQTARAATDAGIQDLMGFLAIKGSELARAKVQPGGGEITNGNTGLQTTGGQLRQGDLGSTGQGTQVSGGTGKENRGQQVGSRSYRQAQQGQGGNPQMDRPNVPNRAEPPATSGRTGRSAPSGNPAAPAGRNVGGSGPLTPQGPLTFQPFADLPQQGGEISNATQTGNVQEGVRPESQNRVESGQAQETGVGNRVRSEASPEAITAEQNRVPFGFGPGPASIEENLRTATQLQQLTETIGKELAIKNRMSVSARVQKAVNAAGGKLVSAREGLSQSLSNLRATWLALKNGYLRPPVEGEFRKAVGDWHLADSETSFYAREFVNKIRSTIKDQLTREALTNYIQADGDMALLADRAQKSNIKYRPCYEAAMKLTEPQKALAANIRQYFDGMLQDGINAGLLDHGVENYITQIWKRPNSITRALEADLQTGRLQSNFNYARQRIFSSFFDGEQAGFAPASKDISALVGAYDMAFNRSLAARGFVKALREAKSPEGEPIARFSGMSQPMPGGADVPEAYLIRSRSLPEAAVTEDGRKYRIVDHPALRGWKFVVQGESATPTYYQADMLVHPDYAPQLKNMLTGSAFRQGKLGMVVKPFLKVGALAKQTKLSLSIFHLDQEGLHGLFHRINPVNLDRIDFTNPLQRELVRGGLQVADYHSMELFSEGLAGGGLVSKIPVLGKIQNKFNEFLFKDYIPRLKMTMAEHAYERNVKRYSDKLSPQQIAELTANQANAAFGELNYKMMGRSQTVQDFLRLTVLAPDFLEARGRFVGQALKPYGAEQRAALALMGASLYVGGRILNQWLDNNPHWDKPFSVIYNGREYKLRTVLGDVTELATDWRRFLYNRYSPWLKLGHELVEGRDYRGLKISNWDAVKDFASWFLPIPIDNRPDAGGVVPRILGSAGVSNKPAETAVTRVYRNADTFRENLNDPKVNAEMERARAETYQQTDYAGVFTAIRDHNDEQAIQEIAKLVKEKGKTPQTMAKYFVNLPFKPFTGSRYLDLRMAKTMTPEQRADYQAAMLERRDIARKFFQLLPAGMQASRQ